jgi:hypothetical protein
MTGEKENEDEDLVGVAVQAGLAPEDSEVEQDEVVAQDVKQITESLLKTYRQELLGRT